MIDKGLMKPPGMAAFDARKENRSGIYSYEQRSTNLDAPYEKSNRVVGRECKTGGNAAEATAKADRRIGERETPALVTEKLAFLNCEPDVTPAAPFVMGCALRVAAAGFFIVRVSLGYELGKRRVHLHVMRHE